MSTDVKGGRRSRADQARATRQRIIETAAGMFTADDYASTTMERVAAQAGVAVQTVYYSFGTKGKLLCEAMEFVGADEHDPLPVIQRPWMLETLTTPSPQRALALSVEHGVDIYERAAPLWPAINAAALVDPAVETYWRGVTEGRRAGMGRLVARILELDGLREGLDTEMAADIMFVLNGHAAFHGLVIGAGWTVPTFKTWLYSTLIGQLLPPGRPDDSATEGLGFTDRTDR